MVLCLGSTCSALHNQGPFKPVCCWQGGRQRWKSSRGTQDGTWPAIEIAQITHIVHIAYNKSESGISCSPVWGKGHDYSAQNRTDWFWIKCSLRDFVQHQKEKNASAYFLNYKAISFERHGKDRTQEQQTIVVESVIHWFIISDLHFLLSNRKTVIYWSFHWYSSNSKHLHQLSS